MVVKRVGPLSAAKNAALLYAVFGLIFGALFSLATMAGAFSAAQQEANAGFAAGMAGLVGIGAIIFLPIFYACIGFVGTLIMAVLYNVIAGVIGGVELDLE